MAKVSYLGLRDPKAAFEELRPFRKALIDMASAYRPFSPEYKRINEVVAKLDEVAAEFTGDPEFYAIKIGPVWR